jgi:peroxiredoxin
MRYTMSRKSIVVLLISVALFVLSPSLLAIPDGSELIGEAIRDFELLDYKQDLHTLYSYRGKVIVLVFWQAQDEYSKQTLLALEPIYRKYKDSGLEVIAVEISGRASDAIMFIARNDVNYLCLDGILQRAIDDYKVEGVPSIFVIDREMHIRKFYAGYDDELPGKLDQAVKAQY